MKKMTCRQLGGACEHEFTGETFDEIAEKSKRHGMEMFQQGDVAHIRAMNEMQTLMNSPEKMQEWMDRRRSEFEGLPNE